MRFAILCNKYNIKYTISTLNESLVTRGRNTLVSFLWKILMLLTPFLIDADIEFNPEDILRMVAYDKLTCICRCLSSKKQLIGTALLEIDPEDENETAQTIEVAPRDTIM